MSQLTGPRRPSRSSNWLTLPEFTFVINATCVKRNEAATSVVSDDDHNITSRDLTVCTVVHKYRHFSTIQSGILTNFKSHTPRT
jgi:adenine deaminase